MNFEGVHVATVSPFRQDGTLDVDRYEEHAKFLIDAGVQGLVPCGTTGESPTLTDSDRRLLIQHSIALARPAGCRVIAGCGGNATHKVLDLILEAEAQGCDATLVVTPYYNRPTPAGLRAHYLHLAERCSKPIFLYHVPGRTNVPLPLDLVETLFEHPRIAGIKEASGQYSYWLGLTAVAARREKLVLAGDDDAFAAVASLGGKGIISASANVVPGSYVQLYEHARRGEWGQAFCLQQKLVPLVRALFSETSPGPLKYALHAFRGHENALRLPLVPVEKSTEALVRQVCAPFFEGSKQP